MLKIVQIHHIKLIAMSIPAGGGTVLERWNEKIAVELEEDVARANWRHINAQLGGGPRDEGG
jgi:hypothetical protein